MNTNPLLKSTLLVASICLALSPIVNAVDPPPDGGYPRGNTAEGEDALFSLTSGSSNTAIGWDALYFNTTGNYNTATGLEALYLNTTGEYNTANGIIALSENTTGSANTATGAFALQFNTTGYNNTATGFAALPRNSTGSNNTAVGINALYKNTSGNSNIGLGLNAGLNLTTGNYNIDIGNTGAAGESGAIRIGTSGRQTATFIAGISGATVAGGVGVIIDTNGQLGTVVSSARFKEAIKPMDKASEAILALRPVAFRYKHDLDPTGIPQFGLVAEEVEKVNPDLVARDDQGKPYTVRYEAVNAMLLNEFLKAHRKIEEQARNGQQQEATITTLKSAIAEQEKEMKALAATLKEQAVQLQTVSELLAVSKVTAQLVANDQ